MLYFNQASKNILSLDNPFARVGVEKLYSNKGAEVPNHKAIVYERTGEVIAVVGKNYKLSQNSEIIPRFEQAIAQSNLNTNGMKRSVQQSHLGARTVVRYTFPEHRIMVKEGDPVDLQIAVLNSYDGSWKFSSLIGAYRLLCTNGMVMGNSFATYCCKHGASLDITFAIKKLKSALDMYLNNVKLWKDYPMIKLNIRQVNDILLQLAGDNVKLMEDLHTSYLKYAHSNGQNLWSLFNTLTDWSTHAKVRNEGNKANVILMREEKVRSMLPQLEELRKAA